MKTKSWHVILTSKFQYIGSSVCSTVGYTCVSTCIRLLYRDDVYHCRSLHRMMDTWAIIKKLMRWRSAIKCTVLNLLEELLVRHHRFPIQVFGFPSAYLKLRGYVTYSCIRSPWRGTSWIWILPIHICSRVPCCTFKRYSLSNTHHIGTGLADLDSHTAWKGNEVE